MCQHDYLLFFNRLGIKKKKRRQSGDLLPAPGSLLLPLLIEGQAQAI
jgi:hypothetical protein